MPTTARNEPPARWTRFAAYIITSVVILAVLYLIGPAIWPVLQILIISIVLTVALDSVVHWLVARGVPRPLAAVGLLLVLITVLGVALFFLVPPIVAQFQHFVADLPTIWGDILARMQPVLARFPAVQQALQPENFLNRFAAGAQTWLETARNFVGTIIDGITAGILIFVTTFYLLANPWPLVYGLRGLFPTEWWGALDRLGPSITGKVRAWVVGTLQLGLVVGVLDYLFLLFINIFYEPDLPFIAFFALLGGLLEVIPVVGPIIAAVVPSLFGFAIDPLLGLLVLGAFFVVQQLENYLIVPLVMGHAVRLHPVSLLVALAVLSALFGLFGAIIAVPVAAMLKVLYDEWYYPFIHDGAHPGPAPEVEPVGSALEHPHHPPPAPEQGEDDDVE